MIRRSVVAVGALLGAWHLWLFGQQAVSGELSDPATGLRWVVAALLLAGLAVLRRRGESMHGRPAVAVWVLAAMLHGPALANGVGGGAPAVPEAVVSVLHAAAGVAAIGLAVLLWSRHAAWALAAAVGWLAPVDVRALPALAPSRRLRFLPRPPPLA